MKSWQVRSKKFLLRHRWSLPLAILSLGFFVRLALEVRDDELGAFDQAVATGFRRGVVAGWDDARPDAGGGQRA